MTKTTEAKWSALTAAREKSGLTVREFAELRGITAATLYWWRSRLGRDTADLVPVEVVERGEVGRDRGDAAFALRVSDSMTLQIRARLRRGGASPAAASIAVLSLPTSVRASPRLEIEMPGDGSV